LNLDADKARALELTPVSRETKERLEKFVALLLVWQEKFNLVSKQSLPLVWSRHISDSLQLLDLMPEAKVWADFGAGAGFPGIPIGCAIAGRPGAKIHLVESVGKKANFLREAVQVTGIPGDVHHIRAENFGDSIGDKIDVVTARALSPLKTLCDLAFPLIARGAVAIFPKGQDVEAELTEAAKYWTIEATKAPSKTSPQGCILIIRGLKARSGPKGRR
jgi:16S rRNA (guanine527-N7)-methyltransferase